MAATDALEIGSIPDRCLRVSACVWRSRKRERRSNGVHQFNGAWSRSCDTLERPAWPFEAVRRRVQPKGVSNGRLPAFLRDHTNTALCLGVPQESVRPSLRIYSGERQVLDQVRRSCRMCRNFNHLGTDARLTGTEVLGSCLKSLAQGVPGDLRNFRG